MVNLCVACAQKRNKQQPRPANHHLLWFWPSFHLPWNSPKLAIPGVDRGQKTAKFSRSEGWTGFLRSTVKRNTFRS